MSVFRPRCENAWALSVPQGFESSGTETELKRESSGTETELRKRTSSTSSGTETDFVKTKNLGLVYGGNSVSVPELLLTYNSVSVPGERK